MLVRAFLQTILMRLGMQSVRVEDAACSPPKASGNDDIAEGAVTRKRIKGKVTMAWALQRKAIDGPGWLNFELEGRCNLIENVQNEYVSFPNGQPI